MTTFNVQPLLRSSPPAHRAIALITRLTAVVLGIGWTIHGDISAGVIAGTGLLLSLLASRWTAENVASWFHLTLFMHLSFGMGLDLYLRSNYYDNVVHFLAMAGLVGIALERLRRASMAHQLVMPVRMHVAVAATLALAFGAAWELTEFALDTCFSLNAQLGLTDTNLDLLADLCGGIAAGALSSLHQPRSIARRFASPRTQTSILATLSSKRLRPLS